MNYYNEFDPNAAAWLRELISAGLIPPGDVDERSINDVSADDLLGYTQCHFFAGIGGWSLALQLAGWPTDRPVWTGSCPCQSFSTAGKQLGMADERDLWPVFGRLIAECRPQYVFGEQVENAIKHGWLDRVHTDLEAQNYAVGAVVLGAHSVGAPHRRQRLYWGAASLADRNSARRERITHSECDSVFPASPGATESQLGFGACGTGVCGVDDTQSDGRGIRAAEYLWKTTREINAPANASCGSGGMADCDESGLERRNGNERPAQCAVGESGLASFPPWSRSGYIYCRDGKIRRVPAESLFLGVADGVPGEMDGSWIVGVSETGGFPLTTQKEGRAMLLKGYGNAIVPEIAAEFVTAFDEVFLEVKR